MITSIKIYKITFIVKDSSKHIFNNNKVIGIGK